MPPTPSAPRRRVAPLGWRGWLRRGAMLLGSVAIGLALAEGGLRAGGFHDDYRRGQVKADIGVLAGTVRRDSEVLVHPYLGFVMSPKEPGVSRYGLFDERPIRPAEAGTVRVALTGGSVAAGVHEFGADALRDVLQAHPAFAGKRVEVLRLAVPGWKQPQQFQLFHWLRQRGGSVDYFVSLDGFNELTLHFGENGAYREVPVDYPRDWDALAQGLHDRAAARIAGEAVALQDRLDAWDAAAAPWAEQSALGFLLWRGRRRSFTAALREVATRSTLHRGQDMATTAGFDGDKPGPELLDELADLWARCSRELHLSCAARGVRYLHCLQPNQYVIRTDIPGPPGEPNTKPMAAAERAICFTDRPYWWHGPVQEGYPKLLARGESLRREGVAFHDLTLLFRRDDEVRYSDAMCHFNASGSRALAEAIGKAILQEWHAPPKR